MAPMRDHTHDPQLRSWVKDANGHTEFPIQNLPFGTFRPPRSSATGGVAIGDHIISLRSLSRSGLLRGDALDACRAADGETLNAMLSLGSGPRAALREALSALLAENSPARPELLHEALDCELLLPLRVGDYTDFYAGINHAENVGRLFRPENPLLPNYTWVPIGYHGRSSSVRVSGEPVRRPNGQRRSANEDSPTFGPTQKLDFELEMGVWIGFGNSLGERIEIAAAEDHIGGYCLLNDWSARDVQAWEYQPLGPFLGKSFHTSVSGWMITPEALVPFRVPQKARAGDIPPPLPYLFLEEDRSSGALGIELEVYLRSEEMRRRELPAQRITKANAADLFWTAAQMVTHHSSNGCNLLPGDMFGTGTISSPPPDGPGSLLELTQGGRHSFELASGESRHFLEDGDEVILRAHAHRHGFTSIGFGECRAVVLPAVP